MAEHEYDYMNEYDCHGLSPGSQVNHTFNDNQINWFKNGSALNAMAAQFKAKK